MTRAALERLSWTAAGLTVLLLTGCTAPQQQARLEATQRWNETRARVKARLAADQFEAGNIAAAAKELAEARRLTPEDTGVLPLQARVLLAEGQTAQAEQLLMSAKSAGLASAEVEYLLGVVRQQQQRWEDARTLFLRAAELDGTQVDYVLAAAQAYLQLDQAPAALEFLEGQVARFGWTDAYQAALAECYEQLGQPMAAAAAWERVLGASAADGVVRARLAEALYRSKRYDQAAEVLQGLLRDGVAEIPERLARLMLGECHLAAGRPAAAREQAQQVLIGCPDDAVALRLLARALGSANEHAAAFRIARRALSVNGDDPRNLELTAGLAWRTGATDEAESCARRLLALAPQHPLARHILGSVGTAGEPSPDARR
jgi:tetratricopeptide (TPR) repeat protein